MKCNHDNCDPSPKILSYLKKNLVYCFDTNVRNSLKENIDNFEIKFFSTDGREQRRQMKENQKARDELNKEQSKGAPAQDMVVDQA